jgi:predicted dehydrogenase
MAQFVHLPNFATLPGCRLVALAEKRPRLARLVAARFGIEAVYSSHHELAADPAIDAVAVSAGYAEQGEIARDLLRAGKHVFTEKPMAVSVAQAERILEAAHSGGARLMVAYMKRYDPGNLLARDTIEHWRSDGDKGRVLYARAHGFCGAWLAGLDRSARITTDEPPEPSPYQQQLPAWLPPEQAPGYIGYLQQYTHNINLLRYLLDAGDDARVRAVDLDADGMTGTVTLDLAGVRAVIESGQLEHHEWDEHTQIYFQKGWIHLWAPPFFVKPAQSRLEIYEGGAQPSLRYPVAAPQSAWSYREEAAHFIQALQEDVPFRSSGEDTLSDVRLFEEIYRTHLRLP